MKTPKYVSSVTALSQAIGLSRQWTSELFRLSDHPKPTKSGHSVARWKKYITRRAEKVRNSGGEKACLELELLRKRIRIADLQISDLDNSRTEEIAGQIISECRQIINALTSQLSAMPNQLSGIFSTLNGPMEIYKQWRDELNKRFESARDALRKVEQKSRRKDNIILLNRANGNGATAVNGAGRA